eukprot:6460146-Amphidinium_carterae.1
MLWITGVKHPGTWNASSHNSDEGDKFNLLATRVARLATGLLSSAETKICLVRLKLRGRRSSGQSQPHVLLLRKDILSHNCTQSDLDVPDVLAETANLPSSICLVFWTMEGSTKANKIQACRTRPLRLSKRQLPWVA